MIMRCIPCCINATKCPLTFICTLFYVYPGHLNCLFLIENEAPDLDEGPKVIFRPQVQFVKHAEDVLALKKKKMSFTNYGQCIIIELWMQK